jgi:hypothetical protein
MDGDRMDTKVMCVKRGDPNQWREQFGSQNLRKSKEAPVMGVEQRQGRKADL